MSTSRIRTSPTSTTVTNNYYHNNFAGVGANRNIPGAVTAAPKSAFTSGAAINRAGTVVPRSAVGNGQLMHTADVAPTRQSVLGRQRRSPSVPPASATNRSVVTRATAPGGPARFNSNQSTMARGNGAAATPGMNAAHAPIAAPSAHYVPRPPSAGGAHRPVGDNATQEARSSAPANPAVHEVPRPPARNDSFAHGNTNSVNGQTSATTQHNQSMSSTAHSTPYNPPSSVPRPPQSSQAGHSNSASQPHGASQQSAPASHSCASRVAE